MKTSMVERLFQMGWLVPVVLLLSACVASRQQEQPVPVAPAGAVSPALNCAPQLGWQAGLGKTALRPSCQNESSGLYRQALRLGREVARIDEALTAQGLNQAERSRLLQERETLINVARVRGWEKSAVQAAEQ